MSLERLPWAKFFFYETKTDTVVTNKAMGGVVGVVVKKETQPEASQRMKEDAERAEDEDVDIPPPLEFEQVMSPITMVETFEAAPIYLL